MKPILLRRREVLRRLLVVSIALAVYAVLTAGLYHRMTRPGEAAEARVAVVQGAQPPHRNIAVRDGWFWVDGERLLIASVGWDPVRPGELPWTRTFRAAEIDRDLAQIRAAGFNAVRSWAPLRPEELALAARHGIRVLQGIWIDPAGDFADPAFRRRTLGEVAQAVEASRWSPAILGYLILNEPRAAAVAKAGLDETRAFLREAAAVVRALDPSAPIGYASWPGMEALDDPLLDFVAFNLYPHRPRVVMDELGLAGYVSLLRRTVARGRPLVISEFGISVSPRGEVQGRGGASEAEQAAGLVELAGLFVAGGATGTSVFQWNDGWWKNHDRTGDELEHDPADPEEWFGLI
ncbi:MAG TPA: glycoside hydrolase family 2 TIM barrel-domain containing protein, partial [Kofleriaceae bacterium]|nr:glycoside hydrolase family 2 TIM barrel-domain containing protein [Kofleriaceae bacterium]